MTNAFKSSTGFVLPQRQQADDFHSHLWYICFTNMLDVLPCAYVSPSNVHVFQKAAPRKKAKTGRKKGITNMPSVTPERQKFVALFKFWQRKVTTKKLPMITEKPKRCLFKAIGIRPCPSSSKTSNASKADL